MNLPEHRLNNPLVIGITITIGSLLLLYWLVMPVVLGSLADTRGLREDQLGWLASCYSAGICAATFASIFWIRSLSWRSLVRVGATGVAIGFAVIINADGFVSLLVGHAIASLFTGIAYAVVMVLLGDSLNPARNYALVFFLQVFLGMGANLGLSLLVDAQLILRFAAGSMIIMSLICVVLASRVPVGGNRAPTGDAKAANQVPRIVLPAIATLAAIVLVFTGDSGIWVFLERIGADSFNRAFGGQLVSINLAAGAIGSLSAAWLAERWGYLWPMVIAIGVSLFSLLLFLADGYRIALILASLLNGWAWNFGAAYRMALVAKLDGTGRYTVLIPCMQTLGNSLGPAMTGLLLVSGSYSLGFSVIAVLWVTALIFYYFGWQGLRRKS